MIETSLTELIVLILAGVLCGLGMVWAVTVSRERARERRRARRQVICPVCGHVFENTDRSPALPCPDCGRLIERQTLLDL